MEFCFRYPNLILLRVFPRYYPYYIGYHCSHVFFTHVTTFVFVFVVWQVIDSSSYEQIKRKTDAGVYTCARVRTCMATVVRACVSVCVCMRACIRSPRPEGINFFAIGPLVGPRSNSTLRSIHSFVN